jgi:hypothetical protein
MSDAGLTHHEWELRQEIERLTRAYELSEQSRTDDMTFWKAEVERLTRFNDELAADKVRLLKEIRALDARIPDPDDMRVFAHPSQYTSWQYHNAQERVRAWLLTLETT